MRTVRFVKPFLWLHAIQALTLKAASVFSEDRWFESVDREGTSGFYGPSDVANRLIVEWSIARHSSLDKR